ncbi:hypothetical protein K469DRAFT_702839 [Zopfia rhizophila CBS 207.26]|uniref:Uncharacterized protein n=1 Tax=Zopfia rhizophila CBS 207.26 TaxID=1314779 RepID=A0A6A6EG62_9PEZI|nr:hypothetical protein K469DRAFT_702839 [Zopfia rhizophila CBS 207.26]
MPPSPSEATPPAISTSKSRAATSTSAMPASNPPVPLMLSPCTTAPRSVSTPSAITTDTIASGDVAEMECGTWILEILESVTFLLRIQCSDSQSPYNPCVSALLQDCWSEERATSRKPVAQDTGTKKHVTIVGEPDRFCSRHILPLPTSNDLIATTAISQVYRVRQDNLVKTPKCTKTLRHEHRMLLMCRGILGIVQLVGFHSDRLFLQDAGEHLGKLRGELSDRAILWVHSCCSGSTPRAWHCPQRH